MSDTPARSIPPNASYSESMGRDVLFTVGQTGPDVGSDDITPASNRANAENMRVSAIQEASRLSLPAGGAEFQETENETSVPQKASRTPGRPRSEIDKYFKEEILPGNKVQYTCLCCITAGAEKKWSIKYRAVHKMKDHIENCPHSTPTEKEGVARFN